MVHACILMEVTYIDAGMVAELLKEYVRDLPAPLIPPKVLTELQEALSTYFPLLLLISLCVTPPPIRPK
jgi:hypothetical protein